MSSADKFSSAAFAELLNVQADCANQSTECAEHDAEPAELFC